MVGCADDKGAEGAGGQLHEVNGDDTPGALDAELLEECRGHDGLAAHKTVGVEQRRTDDAAANNAKPSPQRLRREAHDRTAQHRTQVRHDLCDGDLVLAKLELVLQHGRVQILTAMAHKVEARHEEDEVGEQQPVVLEGDLALLDEDLADALGLVVARLLAQALALEVRVGLGEHETEDDEEEGRAGAEPEQGAPVVAGGVDEAASKGCA